MKKVAAFLRCLANALDKPQPKLVHYPPTCYGIPVTLERVRSNFALSKDKFKDFNEGTFRLHCAADLSDRLIDAVHIIEDGDTVCGDVILVKPYEK